MISSTLNNAVCSSSNWLQKKGTRDPRAPLPPESAFGKCQDLEGFHLIYILWLHYHSVTSSFQKMTFFWKTFIDDDNESDEDCFCGMVEQGKTFRLISNRDHCQRSSPLQISDTPRAGLEPVQNLSSGFAEWSCATVITTTSRTHYFFALTSSYLVFKNL